MHHLLDLLKITEPILEKVSPIKTPFSCSGSYQACVVDIGGERVLSIRGAIGMSIRRRAYVAHPLRL